MCNITGIVLQVIHHPSDVELTATELNLLNSLPSDGVISALLTIFNEETDPTRRSRAYYALLNLQAFDAVQFLITLFDTSDVDWRYAYCCGLGEFHDQRAIAKLCAVLLNDEDSNIRYQAAEALGKIGDTTAITALEHAIQHDHGENFESLAIAKAAQASLQQIHNRIAALHSASTTINLADDVLAIVSKHAARQGIDLETLVNQWLREKGAELE
ncbi:MAG: HEAT repeat domain-containing protein [Acidobacteriota bacterium]